MTKYKWEIAQLTVCPEKAGVENVVVTVHWRRLGTDGVYSAATAGATPVEAQGPFIPFNQLTESQVIQWLETALGDDIDTINADVDKRITELHTPEVVQLVPPWSC